jgi:hypothetical protein
MGCAEMMATRDGSFSSFSANINISTTNDHTIACWRELGCCLVRDCAAYLKVLLQFASSLLEAVTNILWTPTKYSQLSSFIAFDESLCAVSSNLHGHRFCYQRRADDGRGIDSASVVHNHNPSWVPSVLLHDAPSPPNFSLMAVMQTHHTSTMIPMKGAAADS